MTTAARSQPRGLLLAWSMALRVLETLTVLAFAGAVIVSVGFVMAWFHPERRLPLVGDGPDDLFPSDVMLRITVVVILVGWVIAGFVCYRKRLRVQEDGELSTGLPVWPFAGAAGAALALLVIFVFSASIPGQWKYRPVTPTSLILLSIMTLALPAISAVLGMNWFFKLRECASPASPRSSPRPATPHRMSRVLLVHWNRDEARERATRLRRHGHTVVVHFDQGGGGELRKVRKEPPDAIVIDLARLPSHGRAVGVFMRQQKSTRQVPLVFVGGEDEKVARVRTELPDAVYTDWKRIRGALSKALKRTNDAPVVPDTFAAYAGTPLPKKLGIGANCRVALLGAPKDFRKTLGKLPRGVQVRDDARSKANVVLLFTKSAAELERRLPAAIRAVADGGCLWIAWPKKTSAVDSDLTQPLVRRVGMATGLVDYKICAIDDTWSGLRFARRG